MNRITTTFARCRAEGRAALIGYLTGCDPDQAGSLERLRAACAAGLDLLELGVPFSDPTADGPEIQAAMVRALASGSTLDKAVELATTLRSEFPELPIGLFSYANPLLRAGPQALADLAGAHGQPLRVHPEPRRVTGKRGERAAGVGHAQLVPTCSKISSASSKAARAR